MLSGGISILTKSTDGRATPACTHRSEYSSGVRNCRATAWSECLTSIPRSRSTCTARTTQRRQKAPVPSRSEEHTSELQSRLHLVCRLLLEKKKKKSSTGPSSSTND